jgi:hypothetical protein
VWIHYSAGECGSNLRSGASGGASLSVRVTSSLTAEDLASAPRNSKVGDAWTFLKEWRAKENWLNPFNSNDYIELFSFGVVCGMIDQSLNRLAELVDYVTSSLETVKGLLNEVKIAGTFLMLHILNIIKMHIIAISSLFPAADYSSSGVAKFNDTLIAYLTEELKALLAAQAEFWQQIAELKKLFSLQTIKAFVNQFIQEIVSWLGSIKEFFESPTQDKVKILGYSTGLELMDLVIAWFTGGATKLATGAFKQITKTFQSGRDMVSTNLRGGTAGDRTRERTCASHLGCFVGGTMILTSLGAQPIENLQPPLPPQVYVADTGQNNFDPGQNSGNTELGVLALDDTHTLPGDVQAIDQKEITPENWRWLQLSYTKPDGSTAEVYLRRPLWWMEQHRARAPGDEMTLLMPEMGIVGRASLEAILPNTLDTRHWDYHPQGEYAHYPITGFFAHESAEVWDFYFSSSKKPIGATSNHPFYSTDRQQYVFAGELALGEQILNQSGDTIQFLLKRLRSDASTKVYNLEVWRAHNFLVTKQGLVVHNNGCLVEAMGGKNLLCLMEDLKKRLRDPNLEDELERALQGDDLLEAAFRGNPDLVRAWEASHIASDITIWNRLINSLPLTILPEYDNIVLKLLKQKNGPISLGFDSDLTAFAIGTSSVKYQEWAVIFGTNSNISDLNVFASVFNQVTSMSVNGGHKIHFKLDGIIDNPNFISTINNSIPPIQDRVTLWELAKIVRDENLFSNTIFYKNGSVVKLSELLEAGIKPIK